jgi:hypothetical protein
MTAPVERRTPNARVDVTESLSCMLATPAVARIVP